MIVWIDLLLVLLILMNLGLLGSSRLHGCIRLVALQAAILGILPLVTDWGRLDFRMVVLAVAFTTVKAAGLPRLLRRAVRAAGVQREVEPIVGFTTSLLAGMLLLGLAVHLAGRLPVPTMETSKFLIPAALFTIMTGLYLIVTRVKAIMQVLGYLVLENGIYAFGMAFAIAEPLLVETGILLDVFVAVFIMGIMIYHINREFDHIDTDRLSTLKD